MKKLIAGLLGLVLSLMCVVPVRAQNLPSVLISMAVGAPGVVLNSASSTNWGQVFNSNSTTWNLGYGAQSSTYNGIPSFASNGTAVLSWTSAGQIGVNIASVEPLAAQNLFQVDSLVNAGGSQYYYLAYTSGGWLALHYQAGMLPAISGCGTSPSIASGTDEAGDVTLGASGGGSCTVTFASPAPNIPHCACSDATDAYTPCFISAVSTTGLTMKSMPGSQMASASRVDWVCQAHE